MEEMIIRLQVRACGIVQGVGFRPFVYRIANRFNLTGWVLNDDQGVLIEVQGDDISAEAFLTALSEELPPAATIDNLFVKECQLQEDEADFSIKKSPRAQKRRTAISPDLAVCDDCRREFFTKSDRRYHYPFINCTNCGPRFSIIDDVPYDRANTTMRDFPMCPSCQSEYEDPENRRFHAQPDACGTCGPHCWLCDQEGKVIFKTSEEAILKARAAILEGKIVAIKGIGGYHLACDAKNEAAVALLRKRKHRLEKPLAVMAGSLAQVEKMCLLSGAEEKLLKSASAPIVLLKKKGNSVIAPSVAPNNAYLGVMLPYAPIHLLLLQEDDVFVMTSANFSSEPIIYQNEHLPQIRELVDFFLLHNRAIRMRLDDSVVRIYENAPYFIRRSRGYAPSSLPFLQQPLAILACGAQLKNTFCLVKGDKAIVSHHIGDLENKAAFDAYKDAISHYERLFDVNPQLIAIDLHPDYLSSRYGKSIPLPHYAIQHHHAHLAAVLLENKIEEPALGLALDGTGYGPDGTIWGGEVMLFDYEEYQRLAHFRPLPLPGGPAAVREPWRLALYITQMLSSLEKAPLLAPLVPDGWESLMLATKAGLNAPLTSSAGRLFDAAAALLGLCGKISYEGQAAIELEQCALGYVGRELPYCITGEGTAQVPFVIDLLPAYTALLEMAGSAPVGQLAADFHATFAKSCADVVLRLADMYGVDVLALAGGVCQNLLFLDQVAGYLKNSLKICRSRSLPPNDGAISYGQAAIAACRAQNGIL